jgi:hypothetical protein
MQASSEPEGLPAPTGRHQVGRVSFVWVDQGRVEIFSSNPQDRRELVVWVWYPAAPGRDAERAAYLPEPWAPASQFLGLDAAGLRSHAVADAAVADDQSSYPVLVMSPSGFPPLLLAAVAEDLASDGYVVVGVNHTYETTVGAPADREPSVERLAARRTRSFQQRFDGSVAGLPRVGHALDAIGCVTLEVARAHPGDVPRPFVVAPLEDEEGLRGWCRTEVLPGEHRNIDMRGPHARQCNGVRTPGRRFDRALVVGREGGGRERATRDHHRRGTRPSEHHPGADGGGADALTASCFGQLAAR